MAGKFKEQVLLRYVLLDWVLLCCVLCLPQASPSGRGRGVELIPLQHVGGWTTCVRLNYTVRIFCVS